LIDKRTVLHACGACAPFILLSLQKRKRKGTKHTEKSEKRTKKAKEDFMFSSQIKQILLKLFDCMEVACILIIYRQRTRRERENINKKARD
jgi:hypothetical protein